MTSTIKKQHVQYGKKAQRTTIRRTSQVTFDVPAAAEPQTPPSASTEDEIDFLSPPRKKRGDDTPEKSTHTASRTATIIHRPNPLPKNDAKSSGADGKGKGKARERFLDDEEDASSNDESRVTKRRKRHSRSGGIVDGDEPFTPSKRVKEDASNSTYRFCRALLTEK